MIKKILIAIAVLFVVAAGVVFYLVRSSGDINQYGSYYIDDTKKPLDSGLRVTFFGTSNLLIDDGETQLMIDGFFSRPPMSKTLSGKISSDSILIDHYINDYKIDRLKGLFVTHSHYDHSFDCGYVAKRTGAKLYGSASTLNVGRGANVPESQMQEYTPYMNHTFGNLNIEVIPSKHSPGDGKLDGEIKEPLHQPAKYTAYLEGGAFDFLITYKGKKIYIKPSPNFIPGALDSLRADVLLIGIANITKPEGSFADDFYRENVTTLHPTLLIPVHWDNFFEPLSDHLPMLPVVMSDVKKDFDYIIERTKADGIEFKILQGTKSIVLF